MRWLGWIAGNWFHEKWTAEWKWASAIGLLQAVEVCCIRTERRRDRLRTVVIGWCRFFGIFPFCRLAGGIESETANLLKISQWLDASHLAQTIARARKCTYLFYYRAMLRRSWYCYLLRQAVAVCLSVRDVEVSWSHSWKSSKIISRSV